jgi:hypothetical protein
MPTSFTVTHPIQRIPTFTELHGMAQKHKVEIKGNNQAGEFSHQWINGNYKFRENGEIHGDFTGQVVGTFDFQGGKASVTVASRPFWLLEGILKIKLLEGLKGFDDAFPLSPC